MAKVSFGGDPESYMDPPRLTAGSDDEKGGGGFIASLLDALGIHRQVAKGDKPAKDRKKGKKDSQAAAPDVLASVESIALPPPNPLLQPLIPPRSADMNNSLKPIDPNSAFGW
jgi:hypothetical protein